MPVSTSTDFNLAIDELIEKAAARVGGEPILGAEMKFAMQSLDLLFTDMQNRGIMLWTIERKTKALVADTESYTLDTDTLDIVNMNYRITNQSEVTELNMGRIPYLEYMELSNKLVTANRPTQWALDRQRAAPVLYVYPAPNTSAVTDGLLVYWRVRFTTNSSPASNSPDAPRRYWPSLVSGLAYFMGLERPNLPLEKVAALKAIYEEDLLRAMEEDRDRATAVWVPYRSPY